jgi:hypothetical protein
MKAEKSSDSAARWHHMILPWGLTGLVLIGAVLFLFFAGAFIHYPQSIANVGQKPDATTLISTLVVIYTFFVAAFGTLAPFLIDKDRRTTLLNPTGRPNRAFLQVVALLYIVGAISLDVYRIWNSTGDLYATTMRDLPAGKIYDAAAEFTRYLIVNAIVLVFALAVAFWPERRQREIEDFEGSGHRPHPGRAETREAGPAASPSD